jgi:hypothetical protein
VTHVARGKDIPPFLILHVAGNPDTIFGAQETTHNRINADLGRPDDPAPKALFEFLDAVPKKRTPEPLSTTGPGRLFIIMVLPWSSGLPGGL